MKGIIDIDAAINNRFSGLGWAEHAKKLNIIIIGLGGIGSWTALLAARAGYSISAIDFDTVQSVNLGGQLAAIQSVGQRKTESIAAILNELCIGAKVNTVPIKISLDSALEKNFRNNTPIFSSNIIISAVDDMNVRNDIFTIFKHQLALPDSWYTGYRPNNIIPNVLIDGRLLAEQFQVYCVTENDLDRYQETLFSNEEAEEEVCTLKQTSHFAAGIAYNIIKVLNNYISRLIGIPRTLPFYIEEDGLIMLDQKIT